MTFLASTAKQGLAHTGSDTVDAVLEGNTEFVVG